MTHRPYPTLEPLEPRRLLDSVFPNVNVSRMQGNQSEGTIAVDPSNPSRLFAASNAPGDALMAATSDDGGVTWSSRVTANVGAAPDGLGIPRACCDPSAAFDRFGNLYLTYALATPSQGVAVILSTNGGTSFVPLAEFSGDLDQPTVTTGGDAVWVTFTKGRTVAVAGARANALGSVQPFETRVIPHSGGGTWADPAVGPQGQLAVAYQGGRRIAVSVDADGLGPLDFGPKVVVSKTNVGDVDRIAAQASRGIDAEPAIAFDRSGGPFNGRLYLMYSDEQPDGSDNVDVMLRYSPDNGAAWSAPIRINSDTGLGSQFLPRMAVDDASGELAFAWHDTRNDSGSADTNASPGDDAEFFATRARPTADGMLLAPDVQVSQGSSNANASDNSIDLGDYTGLAFHAGVIHPFWADNSNSTADNPDGRQSYLEMYTANVPAASLPQPTIPWLGGVQGRFQVIVLPQRGTKSLGGKADYRFRVTYLAPTGIDQGSLDGSDVLVTGPAGYSVAARLLASRVRRGTVTATYSAAAPGGRWTEDHNGTYLLSLVAGQVLDSAGAPLPGGGIGSFVVRTRIV